MRFKEYHKTMLEILIFIILGIFSIEFIYIMPLVFIFVFFFIKKNKEKKNKVIILFFVLISSSLLTFIRFNELENGRRIEGEGIVTEVKNYEGYNRVIFRNGFSKYYFYDNSMSLERGDKINFHGVIKKHSRRTMPFLFDAREYFYSKGVKYRLEDCRIQFISKTLLSNFENIKKYVSDIFDKYLVEDSSSISKGILLKFNDDNIILKNLVDVGLGHILSVSGLHMGIIFFIIYFLVSIFGFGIKTRNIVSIIVAILYATIIGFSPSIIRSLIMIVVIVYRKIYNPSTSIKDALVISATISLILNPYYIYSIGFLLSYACLFGIVFIYSKLSNLCDKDKSIKGYFIKGFILNISIQLATLPIVVYFFNRINIFSIFLNIILVPIFSLYLILSICLIFTSKIAITTNIIVFILNNLSYSFKLVGDYFNKPYFNLIFRSPHVIVITLYFIVLGYILFYRKINFLKIRYNMFLLTLCIASIPCFFTNKNNDRVEFLDVGQGDCALICVDGKNYLIDSGGNPFNIGSVGENILEPYLIKTGRRKIDIAFITHYDYDHVGGLTEISNSIKINNIISNHKYNLFDDSNKSKKINDLGIKVIKGSAIFNFKKGFLLNTLSGNEGLLNENDRSMVMVLSKDGVNLVLFTGDIESEGESILVKNAPRSFIIKVPHHGSKTSSSEEFIDKVRPKKAIISVGRKNVYHHPNGEVLDRYRKRKIDIFRTDKDGLITLDLSSMQIYRYVEDRNIFDIICIYISFILACLLVIYKEERWIIQFF